MIFQRAIREDLRAKGLYNSANSINFDFDSNFTPPETSVEEDQKIREAALTLKKEESANQLVKLKKDLQNVEFELN